MRLTDTTAVVTGAASGLGHATAVALASRGATVLGLDLPSAVRRAEPHDAITLIGADVTDASQVAAALDRIDDSRPLRVAVSCAGVCPSRRILSSSGPHDVQLFTDTLGVNLVGTFTVMTLAAARMTEVPADEQGQRGVIVNTASIAAFDGQIGQIAYAASKGGVVAMTLPAARDLARHGIRVNTIAPGIVDTPMLEGVKPAVRERLADGVPFPQRLCRPDEYALLAMMIVEHDYLNGETIRVDGALRMAPQ